MKQTTAPKKTPSPYPGDTNPHAGVDHAGNTSAVFVSMALDMSWRLAIVVIAPVIGGFEIDKHFNTAPAWTIIGFVLAMIGVGLVLWQTLRAANQLPVPKLSSAQKKAIQKQYEEEDND